MGRTALSCLGPLALWGCISLASSGCALTNLKETNRRLKESNDRLISENNRLEQELAQLQRERQLPREESAPRPAAATISSADPAGRSQVERDLLIEGLRSVGAPGEVKVDRTSQGIRMTISDQVFFALGQATLSTSGQRVLDRIGRLLNNEFRGHMVRVDGHTDDTPIRKVRNIYPSNWELSTARACTVVRYLVDNAKVDARRIYPAGFSFYRPVVRSTSPTAKSKNRRVEITILNERV
jgi:flagellar motor protein MotB